MKKHPPNHTAKGILVMRVINILLTVFSVVWSVTLPAKERDERTSVINGNGFVATAIYPSQIPEDKLIPFDNDSLKSPDAFLDHFERNRIAIASKASVFLSLKKSAIQDTNPTNRPKLIQQIVQVENAYYWNKAYKKGEFLYYNSSTPTTNAVISYLNVTNGAAELYTMNGTNAWTFRARSTKNNNATASWAGYPGYYGAKALCVTPKCTATFLTYLIY